MVKKGKKLNQWLWKWHFIAGIISLPFILILAITGGVYLFKDAYEAPKHDLIKIVKVEGNPMSFQEQWGLVKALNEKPPTTMVIPTRRDQATEFITGKFGHVINTFVNPYKAEISGTIKPSDSGMHTVRKLHGELLLGSFGTKIVELVACWLIVLLITGIYVFWPTKKEGIKGFFRIRLNQGKRILFRDLHTVLGFWISGLLLITLAGGLPWTDVFGSYFKWVQEATNTGYPKTWEANGLQSLKSGQAISLDDIVAKANQMDLSGETNIGLPKDEKGVYTIFNTTFNLKSQKRFHIDQYSGKQIMQHNWEDVGVLMRARMWVMAFHQGQFGFWNWLLMLTLAVLLAFIAIAALISYVKRKPKGEWGTPKVATSFKVGYGVIILVVLLGVIFPLFGLSALIIVGIEYLKPLVSD